VALLTWGLGVAPWISIVLAVTFGVYGLIKRFVSAGPVVSVSTEVLIFLPFAAAYLIWIGTEGSFGQTPRDTLLSHPVRPVDRRPPDPVFLRGQTGAVWARSD
jgi:chloramphenicol-sensitive protein RarD